LPFSEIPKAVFGTPSAVMLDLLKLYRMSVDNNVSLCFFIICCAHYSKYTLNIGIFLEVFAANYFSITGTLLGMAPDLTAVVLVGNGTISESSGSCCWEWHQI
jgi:hypothetical protein